jgi:hypothetical protein
MFIAYCKEEPKKFVEFYDKETGESFTWDNIPYDVSLTALTITHPISLIISGRKIHPKVSINKYHYYYFFNEATISIVQSSSGGPEKSDPSLIAKVIAGVDVEREYVLEVRLDKFGNTSITSYPLYALLDKFKNGQMRKSILRTGISCAPEKKLL